MAIPEDQEQDHDQEWPSIVPGETDSDRCKFEPFPTHLF